MGWFFRRLTGWNVGISVLGSVVREMCGFSGRRMTGLHILRKMNKVKHCKTELLSIVTFYLLYIIL